YELFPRGIERGRQPHLTVQTVLNVGCGLRQQFEVTGVDVQIGHLEGDVASLHRAPPFGQVTDKALHQIVPHAVVGTVSEHGIHAAHLSDDVNVATLVHHDVERVGADEVVPTVLLGQVVDVTVADDGHTVPGLQALLEQRHQETVIQSGL